MPIAYTMALILDSIWCCHLMIMGDVQNGCVVTKYRQKSYLNLGLGASSIIVQLDRIAIV